MARLLLLEKGKINKEIQITEDKTRIGREGLNNILLPEPTVSRFHAEITRRGHCYSIEDKKSTNGTSLNGVPLVVKTILNNNDKITIGGFTLLFEMDDSDAASSVDTSQLDSTETIFDLTQKMKKP